MKKVNKEVVYTTLLSFFVIGFMCVIYGSVNLIGKSYAMPGKDDFDFPQKTDVVYLQNSPYYKYRYYDDNVEGCEQNNPNYDTLCPYASSTVYYNPKEILTFSDENSQFNKIVRLRNYVEYEIDMFYIFDVYSYDLSNQFSKFYKNDNEEVDANFYTNFYDSAMQDDVDPGLKYLVSKMYEKYITGVTDRGIYFVNDDDYYKTQLAIWYYLARLNINDSNANKLVEEIESYVKNGNKIACEIHDLVISVDNEKLLYDDRNSFVSKTNDFKFSLSEDGKYIESETLEFKEKMDFNLRFDHVNFGKYNSVVELIDAETGEKITYIFGFNKRQFRYRIPVEEFDKKNYIKFEYGYNVYYSRDLTRYYKNDSMSFVSVYNVFYPVDEMSSFIFIRNAVGGLFKIENVDAQTGKAVSGTTIRIDKINEKGEREKASTIVTGNSDNYAILEPGKYIATQIATNKDYERSNLAIEFEINESQESFDIIRFSQTPIVNVPDTGKDLSKVIYIIAGVLLTIGISIFGFYKFKKEL